MSESSKPRPRWSDPVWVRDTTYRFVNVGNGPAFDVVYTTRGDEEPFPGMPRVHVPETRIEIVPPGRAVDVQIQVLGHSFPEQPVDLDPRQMGWPPISPVLTLAWNDTRGWAPAPDTEDPFGAEEYFGFRRSMYSTLVLPPNQVPTPTHREYAQRRSGAASKAMRAFVQYERVLNVWLSSVEGLQRAIDDWETNVGKGRELFSMDPDTARRAHGELRHDLDVLSVTAFVSLTMLAEHGDRMLQLCDSRVRQEILAERDVMRRKFPFARHADTVRNYLAHRGLLNWIVSHTDGSSTCSIKVDLAPILEWAQTRDRNRTEPQNVMFAEFLMQYGDFGRAGKIPLRTWIDELVGGNRDVMLQIHRETFTAIGNIL